MNYSTPQQRYRHGKPSEATIYAGMIGIGCTIGLRRMMRISRGVTEAELVDSLNSGRKSRRLPATLGTRLLASFGCVFAQFLQKPQQCQSFVF